MYSGGAKVTKATLGPREAKILAEIANATYDWLPGSAPPFEKIYTFKDAAAAHGLDSGWVGGSKLPAIQLLLKVAFEKGKLGDLLVTITSEGIKYRERKGASITKEDIKHLDELLLLLGLKIPELSDPAFLSVLPSNSAQASGTVVSRAKLHPIMQNYQRIETNPDAQSRGYEFQSLLHDLFEAFDMEPKQSFRITGEEIDGSFVLDSETYLLEARWRTAKAGRADLGFFSDKVERKSAWTRGLFISMSGFSEEAITAMKVGKPPGFVIMSRDDLLKVLEGRASLPDLLREKVRVLAERGEMQ